MTEETTEARFDRIVKQVSDEMEANKTVRRPTKHVTALHRAIWNTAQIAIRRTALATLKEELET